MSKKTATLISSMAWSALHKNKFDDSCACFADAGRHVKVGQLCMYPLGTRLANSVATSAYDLNGTLIDSHVVTVSLMSSVCLLNATITTTECKCVD
ncbi:hypothetical protein J6590_005579 [Homalodisca vitripennis]|nr:hypothetical protein J6590_005579 [Homalodisca vitripennis]